MLSRCEISERGGESNAWSGFLFWSTEDQTDGVAEALPIDELRVHLPAAFLCEGVEFSFAAGFGFFPFGLQPTSVFQAMEGGIEGALMDPEEVFRYLLKALRDGIAVAGTQGDHLQNQHIEGSAEEFLFAFGHCDT